MQGQEYMVVGEQFLSWGRHGQPDMKGEAKREAASWGSVGTAPRVAGAGTLRAGLAGLVVGVPGRLAHG